MNNLKPRIKRKAYKILMLTQKKFLKLLNLNRGFFRSKMKTKKLFAICDQNSYFQIRSHRLVPILNPQKFIDLSHMSFPSVSSPAHIELDITWKETTYCSGQQNNILGDNGILLIDALEIKIPVVPAKNEYLHYYHAHLISPGKTIKISNHPFPIWKMKISKDYVKNYLMTQNGGGFYLEYHTDQPHYHHNLQGEGYYILGKTNSSFTKLQLTAFTIPQDHAIYTEKGVIHCDAALTGSYLVGYHLSNEFSTVLLRKKIIPIN